MCQLDSNIRIRKETFRGYRVYDVTEERIVSIYGRKPISRIGKRVNAESERFHAFRSKTSLKKWFQHIDSLGRRLDNKRVYLVELSDGIRAGDWSGNPTIKTVTGYKCKIIKEVTKQMRGIIFCVK